jgi:hypothetical protein
MITPLGFATGPSLNHAERLPIKSKKNENTDGRQQMFKGKYIKMSVNGASTIFSFASRLSYVPIGVKRPFLRYWQPLLAKTTVTCSLRHPENESQRSVNDFQLCILSKLCSNRCQTSIYEILAAFTGINDSDMLPAAS